MTMRFVPHQNVAASSANQTAQIMFYWLDFMRSSPPTGPGWSIVRSGNGVNYTDDGVGGLPDNIASWSDLNQHDGSTYRSWVILQSPDGAREFLWYKNSNSNHNLWASYYSPTASFTGGDLWNPANAPDQAIVYADNICANNLFPHVLRFGADDADPYGWWVWGHYSGNFTNSSVVFGQIPMAAYDPDDSDPFVFHNGAGGSSGWLRSPLTTISYGINEPKGHATKPGTTSTYYCNAMYQRYDADDTIVPNEVEVSAAGRDWSFPMVWQRDPSAGNGFHKGVSDFMEWNGVERAAGHTFDDLSRISLGDVNVEWDSVTPPASS